MVPAAPCFVPKSWLNRDWARVGWTWLLLPAGGWFTVSDSGVVSGKMQEVVARRFRCLRSAGRRKGRVGRVKGGRRIRLGTELDVGGTAI